jgi:hypothetical protein
LVPSSDDWQEFEGTSEARSLLGGAGNVDDNLLELPAGSYRAVSLRAFDSSSPASPQQWSPGTGLVVRRRQDVGGQLGDGVHAPGATLED